LTFGTDTGSSSSFKRPGRRGSNSWNFAIARGASQRAGAFSFYHFIIFCTFAMKDVPPEFGFGNELFSAKSEPF
jgi:hypothetical protein